MYLKTTENLLYYYRVNESFKRFKIFTAQCVIFFTETLIKAIDFLSKGKLIPTIWGQHLKTKSNLYDVSFTEEQ